MFPAFAGFCGHILLALIFPFIDHCLEMGIVAKTIWAFYKFFGWFRDITTSTPVVLLTITYLWIRYYHDFTNNPWGSIFNSTFSNMGTRGGTSHQDFTFSPFDADMGSLETVNFSVDIKDIFLLVISLLSMFTALFAVFKDRLGVCWVATTAIPELGNIVQSPSPDTTRDTQRSTQEAATNTPSQPTDDSLPSTSPPPLITSDSGIV